jgi:prepilin-type N-terminal cleavage/methylation domain-containing protein
MLSPAMLTTRRRTRRGFTLVELLITMVLLGLVSAVIVTVVVRQQRFYRSTSALMDTRAQIRQMASILPMDLRGISSAGGDIVAMSESALEFRSSFGSSVVCTLSSSTVIVLTPRNGAKGLKLTSWTRTPVVGDSIALYDVNTSTRSTDDRWTFHQITAITTVTGDVSTGCRSTTGLVQSADMTTSNPSYRITISPSRPTTLAVGSAVRLFRRARYSLYAAADGLSYLGYRDCLPGRTPICSEPQPVAGPYRQYAAAGTNASGLEFAYFDSTGNVTTVPRDVARISVAIRGETATQLQLADGSIGTPGDSLSFEVALRNRK